MRKIIYLCVIALLVSVPAGVYAQQKAGSLERAIVSSVQYLFDRLPEGSKIAVYGFSTPANARVEDGINLLSDHLIDEITTLFSREYPRFITTNRDKIEVVRKELNLQLSGDINDETAKSIGKMVEADFVITGSIRRVYGGYRITVRPITVETNIVFSTASANIAENDPEFNSFLVHEESQKHFRISLGGRAGVSPRFRTLSGDITGTAENPSPEFAPAISGAFFFTDVFALQTELVFSRDRVSYYSDEAGAAYAASFESYSLQLPVLARFTIRPGIFSLSGFGGAAFNIPLGAMKLNSDLYDDSSYRFSIPAGYVAGVNLGIRLGSGVLFSDIRFSGDFTNTVIHDDFGTLALYQRNTWCFSLGYEFEFIINRNK